MKYILVILIGTVFILATLPVEANYFRHRDSDVDSEVFRIAEKNFMGVQLDQDLELIDQHGAAL